MDFVFLRVRFCGIVESGVDSAESAKLPFFGCLESVKERGLYFWQKPKVAKTFKILRDCITW